MEQCEVIGTYISDKRKQCGYTQQQVADYLKVSCQAVSKWEKGMSYPSVVVLKDLAHILGVSVDEILSGKDKELLDWEELGKGLEFSRYGRLRRHIAGYIDHQDERLLYAKSSDAILYEPDLEKVEEPVLAFMVNNLGSKLKMIIDYEYHELAGEELVNRLINELLVKGAKPILFSHTTICGNIDGLTLELLIKGLSSQCKENHVTFAGSEVSFQPDSCAEKEYSMTGGIIGVVDKKKMIDGHKIKEGDSVIGIQGGGVTSSALLQRLIAKYPKIKGMHIGEQHFMDEVMRPTQCFYKALKEVIAEDYLHGLIHLINGIVLPRYYESVPNGLSVELDMRRIPVSPFYEQIMEVSGLDKEHMVRYFNLGIGMLVIVDQRYEEQVLASIGRYEACWRIGKVIKGNQKVSIRH